MAVDFFIKQGDTAPPIVAILKDALGTVVQLAGCSVRFIMVDKASGVTAVDAPCDIVDAGEGRVSYQWVTGDTDIVSTYNAEYEVVLADSNVETFPNSKYIVVKVVKDLGGTVG